VAYNLDIDRSMGIVNPVRAAADPVQMYATTVIVAHCYTRCTTPRNFLRTGSIRVWVREAPICGSYRLRSEIASGSKEDRYGR
jgi:hypothetical protein